MSGGLESRRMRANALLCLSAGAGLVGADLKAVTGEDVVARSGGVVVCVRAGRRPRVVPVLSGYHERLHLAARFAGARLLIGGTSPTRRNVTTPLTSSLSGGRDLPRLDIARLRATWLVSVAETIGLKAFWTRPASPAPSASGTSWPFCHGQTKRAPSPCSARSGPDARRPRPGRGTLRRPRAGSRDRPHRLRPPARGESPPVPRAHLRARVGSHPGRPPSGAPLPGARGARLAPSSRPPAPRGRRRLARGPPSAHLPPLRRSPDYAYIGIIARWST